VKVRLQSLRDGAGLQITDAETGNPIENCFEVVLRSGQSTSFVNKAELHIYLTEMDVVAEAERVTVCPECREKIDNSHKFVEFLTK
jgi:hypothetical protein